MRRKAAFAIRSAVFMLHLAINTAAIGADRASPADPCADGLWADFMLGSHHIHPYRHFDDFNPGIGFECSIRPQWAATVGYFRNSLDRPSFYTGAVYTPAIGHWRWFSAGAMGGVITGYNFARFGVGSKHRTGGVIAPTAIAQFGRFGMNLILIPPIRENNLPFTVGFQAKLKFKE